jgi:hypothetical protein
LKIEAALSSIIAANIRQITRWSVKATHFSAKRTSLVVLSLSAGVDFIYVTTENTLIKVLSLHGFYENLQRRAKKKAD